MLHHASAGGNGLADKLPPDDRPALSLPTPADPFDWQFDAPVGPVSLAPPFRPAPTPTCAGLTPGFEFLVREARRRKRRPLKTAIRTERATRAGQVAQLAKENGEQRKRLDQLFAEVEQIRTTRQDGSAVADALYGSNTRHVLALANVLSNIDSAKPCLALFVGQAAPLPDAHTGGV
jgi:hypothetical protein